MWPECRLFIGPARLIGLSVCLPVLFSRPLPAFLDFFWKNYISSVDNRADVVYLPGLAATVQRERKKRKVVDRDSFLIYFTAFPAGFPAPSDL